MSKPLTFSEKSILSMAEISSITVRTQTTILNIEDGRSSGDPRSPDSPCSLICISFVQKLIGEFVGTFSLVFAGCSATVVNDTYGELVTLPGIALAWGLTVMVMSYSIGHVSGAHFNPAVSIALASSRKFPFKQVPGYIAAQLLGSTLAAEALRLMFHLNNNVCSLKGDVYVGTHPSATDRRANRSFAGVAIGATVVLNILFSGPISGASMNPARSLAPAYIWGCYKDLWLYIVSPVIGALTGAWIYNILRSTNKSYGEIIRPNCNKVSSNDHQEASQDDSDSCVLRVVDPNNRKFFILSSPTDINETCNVTCKLA
ncbi:unnamed protein product [Brassica oleracea]